MRNRPIPVPILYFIFATITTFVAVIPVYENFGQLGELLSLIASIQATAFAIVFSISILGVQIATSRYSPHLADLLRRDRVYITTAGSFFISIMLDIFFFLIHSSVETPQRRLISGISIGSAVTSFVILFLFADNTLKMTTPVGITEKIYTEANVDDIIEKLGETQPGSASDPFIKYISAIDSSVGQDEQEAAVEQTRQLKIILEKIIEQNPREIDQEDSDIAPFLNNMANNKLQSTLQDSVEAGMEEVSLEVVKLLLGALRVSGRTGNENATIIFSSAVGEVIRETKESGVGRSVRQEAISGSSVVKQFAKQDEILMSGMATRIVSNNISLYIDELGRDENLPVEVHQFTNESISDGFKLCLERIDGDINQERCVSGPSDLLNGLNPEKSLWYYHRSLSEITSGLMRFYINDSKNSPGWQISNLAWLECVGEIEGRDMEVVFDQWFSSLLYIEYVADKSDALHSGTRLRQLDPIPASEFDRVIERIENSSLDNVPDSFEISPNIGDPIRVPMTGTHNRILPESNESFENWITPRKDTYNRIITNSDI